MNKKIKYICNTVFIPKNLIWYLASKNIIKMKDDKFLKLTYRKYMKKELDLNNPVTFNEKLQWLKLNDRKAEYTTMVDKYEVKKYVANIIGEEYIIPTIGIYKKFNEIDFTKLPNQFVIKCTHDSGGLVIVKDKTKLDIRKTRKKINKCLRRNFYYQWREWPYKNIKPRIIIEEYKKDSKSRSLKDYKFLCFDGKPKYMFIATDRDIYETKFNFYDMNFNFLNIKQHYPNDKRKIEKPKNFEKMKELASKLSKEIPHVRVDFYEIDDKIFFGELTFYHFGGIVPFQPEEWDYELGDLIRINRR